MHKLFIHPHLGYDELIYEETYNESFPVEPELDQ